MGKLKWIQLPIQAAKYANKALDKDGAGLTVIELSQTNLNLDERFTGKKEGLTVLTPLLFKGDIVAKPMERLVRPFIVSLNLLFSWLIYSMHTEKTSSHRWPRQPASQVTHGLHCQVRCPCQTPQAQVHHVLCGTLHDEAGRGSG